MFSWWKILCLMQKFCKKADDMVPEWEYLSLAWCFSTTGMFNCFTFKWYFKDIVCISYAIALSYLVMWSLSRVANSALSSHCWKSYVYMFQLAKKKRKKRWGPYDFLSARNRVINYHRIHSIFHLLFVLFMNGSP